MNALRVEHAYLDLDRTLFDTERAKSAIYRALEDTYGIAADRLVQERAEHYVHPHDDETYYYPLFKHLESTYEIDPDEAASCLEEQLRGQDFLYPDAVPLLDDLEERGIRTSILTFGDVPYQQFKVALCEELFGMSALVTTKPKGKHIGQAPSQRSLIVDDKRVADLPKRCQGIQLDRRSEIPAYNAGDYLVVNGLHAVSQLLDGTPPSLVQ